MNWEGLLKDFLGSWKSGIRLWQFNGEMERTRVYVKGSVQEGMRKSEGEWDRMRGGESKKRKQDQVRKSLRRARKCMRAGNSDCKSNSEGKCQQESNQVRACRWRPCLTCSVMSAINNARCKKLSCWQWTVFWSTYYRSEMWPNTMGLEHWSSATNTVFESNIN